MNCPGAEVLLQILPRLLQVSYSCSGFYPVMRNIYHRLMSSYCSDKGSQSGSTNAG